MLDIVNLNVTPKQYNPFDFVEWWSKVWMKLRPVLISVGVGGNSNCVPVENLYQKQMQLF